jgi:hypothetical protein
LLQGTEWDRPKIDETLASKKSVQANLAQPIPVYIVYFTVATTSDAAGYLSYSDLYKRDPLALAALKDLPLPAQPTVQTAGAVKPGAKPGAKPAAASVKPAKPKPSTVAAN